MRKREKEKRRKGEEKGQKGQKDKKGEVKKKAGGVSQHVRENTPENTRAKKTQAMLSNASVEVAAA